jgi:adenylate kinase family enzyme
MVNSRCSSASCQLLTASVHPFQYGINLTKSPFLSILQTMSAKLPNIVIIYGAIGAGKGTQVNLLQQKVGGQVSDTGSELRAFVKNFSQDESHQYYEAAVRIGEMMKHEPVLTEDLFLVLQHRIESVVDSGELLIMDKPGGVLLEEAQWFLELLCKKHAQVCFINLDISVEEAIQRSSHRWYVEGSKVPYPSKDAALNDAGDNDIYQRPEDTDRYHVTGRYQTMYTDRITELEKIFDSYGVPIHHINAERSVEEINNDIVAIVHNQENHSEVCQPRD